MASYNELLALIDAYINQNGVQAITGQVLNGVLRAMVDQLGRGYAIMGAAAPTTDPGTPDGPETWFASVPGTYTNFDGIQIVPGELAMLSYEPSTGFSKNTIYEGFQTVQATIDGNVGTPAVGVSYANGILSFDFHNMKGVTGDPAGFGAVTASVDSNIGTPSVQVQTSGPDTAKAIAFQFHNLKGETGVTSVLATVDNTSGNPQCAVSLNGQQLVLNFTGLKGAQGDTGSSVDYPFTIVNNLTTNDATQALSAAMGVQLESEVSQLEAKLTDRLGYYQNDPDYIRAYTDKEGRFLFGIKTDGSIEWAIGIPTPVKEALADKVDEIVGKALIDEGFADAQSSEDNPEYLSVIIDSEGKMVANREKDGTLAENVGIKAPIVSIVGGKKDSDSSDAPTIKIGGTFLSEEKDKESRMELFLDSVGRILSERRADGVKVESAGLSTPKLYLTGDGLSDLARDFRNIGLISNDWTDASELHIPIPNFAVVNISGIETMPQTKTTDAKAVLQFWDMNGNYFKKEVIANAQGNSSLAHPKKNIAIDICNNNGWDDDDTFSLQIGDWIPQDSFHLKAYYNDPFRGLGAVGYELYDEMCRSRGVLNDYVWKRALFDLEDVTATSTGEESGEDAEGQFFTGAKCFPKGFPVIIYLNGSFYGIFAWQLKKHRDNYHLKKNKAKQIHLDGILSNEDLFNANGDSSQIVWTTNSPEGIEVRNPKTLYLMDGTKYNADNNGGELIDATSPNYNPGNADHIITAEVKAHILDLSRVKGIISTARTTYESSPKTDADLATFKSVFETYFDPDNLIDYLILSDVVNNYDGWAKNWQWLTYNGTKWYVMPYDLDGIFGNWWQLNDTIVPPLTAHTASGFWTSDIINYYGAALNARYAELRNAGILDVKHIQGLCVSWLDRIGNKAMFDKEWEKWPGFIKNDSPMRLAKWIEESISNNDIIYQFNQ